MHSSFSKLIIAFAVSLACVVSASATPAACHPELETWQEKRIIIGYRGIREPPQPPVAAHGGQLGAVLYVTDSVDLARHFAIAGNPAHPHICIVSVDADAWTAVHKSWVPQAVLNGGGGAVDAFLPHGVVFARHLVPIGFPVGAPNQVFQLGVRQAEIATLTVRTDCRPAAQFANDHHTLNYAVLGPVSWGVVGVPAFSFEEVDGRWESAISGSWISWMFKED